MTEHRVMSAGARAAEQQAARTAELVGDGTAVTLEDFTGMGAGERQQLYNVNPDRYRALVAEQDKAADRAARIRRNGGR